MATSPKAGFTLMPGNILKNEDLFNQYVIQSEALLYSAAISRTVTDPAGASPAPVNGDTYIVPASGAGDFSGQDDNIAVYFDGWRFIPALDGATIWVIDEGVRVQFRTGSGWVTLPDNTVTVREFADATTDIAAAVLDFNGPGQDISLAGSVATITIPGGPPPVQNQTTTDPSLLSPQDGQRWIVGAGAVGVWAGQDNNIAIFSTEGGSPGAWTFYVPGEGQSVVDLSDGLFYTWSIGSPTVWAAIEASGSDGDAIHASVSGEFAAIAEKASPTASDRLLIEDVADGNAKKRIDIGNLPSAASTLAGLSDVDLGGSPSPADGDVLTFDGTSGSWIHEPPAAGSGGVAYSRLTASGTTSLPNNTVTKVGFATTDVAGGFLAGAPASGFKVPSGVSRVHLSWYATISGTTGTENFRILKNGATLIVLDSDQNVASGSWASVGLARGVACVAGDEFTLHAFQNGGLTETINAAGGEYYFMIEDGTP